MSLVDRVIINNILDAKRPRFNSQIVCGTDDSVNKWFVEYKLNLLSWTLKYFDSDKEEEAIKFFNDAHTVIRKRNKNKIKSTTDKIVDVEFLGDNMIKIIYEDKTDQKMLFIKPASALCYWNENRKK